MSPARLSALDAAFLSLESAEAPMHVGWAAVFAPPATGPRPRFEAVLAHIASRLGRAPHPGGARPGDRACAAGHLLRPPRRLRAARALGTRPIGRAGALDALPLRHSGAAQLAGV
jgi:hypothetical protein